MRIFGNKKEFAIEYELDNFSKAEFKLYLDSKSICAFKRNNIIYEFKWDIRELVDWLELNLNYVLSEEGFPLPVEGNTAVELYQNSGEFDSEDDDTFDSWYEKRQDWSFRHSWYSSRAGGYLADVYFRKVGDKIEISWDNCNLYDNIEFLNPVGLCYIELKQFKGIIENFIKAFRLDIELYSTSYQTDANGF